MILGIQEIEFLENPNVSPHTHYVHAVYTGCVQTVIKDNLPA
jgi:hypothetical protein